MPKVGEVARFFEHWKGYISREWRLVGCGKARLDARHDCLKKSPRAAFHP